MRGITVHFGDVVEEREREEKRRVRKSFAGAAVLALLGGVAAWPRDAQPPAKPSADTKPEVRIVERVVYAPPVTTIVTKTVTRTKIEQVKVPVIEEPKRDVEPEVVAARHLCISPKWIRYTARSEPQRVTISNPSTDPVTITRIALHGDRARSGFAIDATACEQTTLQPGERCQVTVELRQRIGETLQLLVYSDRDAQPEPMVIAAAELD